MKLEVGQKLWYVPSQRRHNFEREVTVLKVGRKWAQLDCRDRININTLEVDGGAYMSPAQCYIDREAYEAEVALEHDWRRLRHKVERAYRRPDGVTIDDIKTISRMLGFDE